MNPADIASPPPPATTGFADFTCPACRNTGHVCEDHPGFAWEGLCGSTAFHLEHGGVGMPCPVCCDPVPADGSHGIAEAFVPRHLR